MCIRARSTLVSLAVLLCYLAFGSSLLADWPQWRGPALDGTSPDTGLPTQWGPDQNVRWQLALPERSGATPIVTGDRIFVLVSHDPEENDQIDLWAVDRTRGERLWVRTLGTGNVFLRKHHLSSPSPATDGSTVWAVTGTGIVAAFETSGEELWRRDLQKEYGPFGLKWGYSSSPVLWEGDLFLQVLHGTHTDAASYLLRLDGATGETLWRVERPEAAHGRESPDSYTTPAFWSHHGRVDLVIVGADVVTGHDPDTGHERWRASGLNPEASANQRLVASPLPIGDRLVVFAKRGPTLAFQARAEGAPELVWQSEEGTDVPTPVSDGTYLYIVTDKGFAYCLEVETGETRYGPERLPVGTYSASPLLADGRIFATNENGVTSVLRSGPSFELLASSSLEGFTLSSLAVSRGQLFLRTSKFLYAIGDEEGGSSD